MFNFQSFMEFCHIGVRTMLQSIDHEYDEGVRVQKGIDYKGR